MIGADEALFALPSISTMVSVNRRTMSCFWSGEKTPSCQSQWMSTLERAAEDAHAKGELGADSDPAQLVFELEAALLSANWYFHLFEDASYLQRARRAVRARLGDEATASGLLRLPTEVPGQPD